MTRFQSLLYLISIIAVCNVIKKAPVVVNAKSFEYELPNRTITICPSYSLISLECPQIQSLASPNHHLWEPNLPKYLISIDYIRSFPLRLGFDPRSCQPDITHACNNYDLRYLNTLCSGKPQCSEISAYQIRERSLCTFKAVTEIGFHCVPTWNLYEIQTKYDICRNSSLTNDYGFIYSSNYPLKANRISCFTTIYTRPNYKIILYYVHGELNHDQLRIESVTSDRLPVLNITLNGNLSTQRLAASIYEIKITFIPSQIYSYHPTYYLLYFYTVPICSIIDPCPSGPLLLPIAPFFIPTTLRMRIQSIGWTRVQNIWIVIPIILAYILLLLLIVVLALLFRRRRKRQKLLASIGKATLSSRYLDASGASSRAQLVTPLPPAPLPLPPPAPINDGTYHRTNVHYPLTNSSFAENMERYYRSSRSDFDLHQNNNIGGIDYRHHASIPNRIRPIISNDSYRGYGTMDNNYDGNRQRRSLPKSFSDCDLCKRRIVNEEYQQYCNEKNDNWHLENTIEGKVEPRPYRDKIKERFRERIVTRQIPDNELISSQPPPTTTVEYSTVLPRHQRIANESNRPNGPMHHLPFEYISNENPNEFKRNSSQERLGMSTNQQHLINDENGRNNFTMKYYEHDDNETKTRLNNRRLHDTREMQEMSMRMNDQQNLNRHQYYHQQRYFPGNNNDM